MCAINIGLYAVYLMFNTDLTASLYIHGRQVDAQIFLLETLLETRHHRNREQESSINLTIQSFPVL